MSETLINIGLWLTYIMIGIAAIAAIVFPVIYMIKYPKSARETFIGFGAILVLCLIAYLLAGGEVKPSYQAYGIGSGGSKFVSTGLILFYIMALIAIGTAIYSEVARFFK